MTLQVHEKLCFCRYFTYDSISQVACIYSNQKIEKFVTEELGDSPITAVLADTFDVKGKSLFYAG